MIGNGDIMTRAEGVERAKQSGVEGIMIGRGIFQDPFVFAIQSHTPDLGEMLVLLKKHVVLHRKTWKGDRFEPLKKFVKMYINGFAGAAEVRAQMFAAQDHDELLGIIDKYQEKL